MFACCFISPLFCLQHQSNLNLNDIVYKIVINYESFALQENEDEMKMIFFQMLLTRCFIFNSFFFMEWIVNCQTIVRKYVLSTHENFRYCSWFLSQPYLELRMGWTPVKSGLPFRCPKNQVALRYSHLLSLRFQLKNLKI